PANRLANRPISGQQVQQFPMWAKEGLDGRHWLAKGWLVRVSDLTTARAVRTAQLRNSPAFRHGVLPPPSRGRMEISPSFIEARALFLRCGVPRSLDALVSSVLSADRGVGTSTASQSTGPPYMPTADN